jgi:beta-glucosidase-like glycosyl hydrolase
LRTEASYPLLFGIDAEWGLGMRLEDQKTYPKNRVLGLLQDKNYIYEQHKQIAQDAKKIGINFLTSPVADTAPISSYMKDRSYGPNPNKVSICCQEASKALAEEKIIGCGKHFPGHGRTVVDSHVNMPVISQTLSEIENYELVPFQHLINNRIPCIMVGHLIIDAIDRNNPATLSHLVIKMLREKMNFNGVIISDALDMGAIRDLYRPTELNIKALQAGIDTLLFPREVIETIESLKKIAEKDITFMQEIKSKINRINRMMHEIEL